MMVQLEANARSQSPRRGATGRATSSDDAATLAAQPGWRLSRPCLVVFLAATMLLQCHGGAAASPTAHAMGSLTSRSALGPSPASAFGAASVAAASQRHTTGPRHVMLAAIWEQLSKGRWHLMETMALARAINRTLILTNVSNSWIGFSRKLPMSAYFDVEKMRQTVPCVEQSEYFRELRQRQKQQQPKQSLQRRALVSSETTARPWLPGGSRACGISVAVFVYHFEASKCSSDFYMVDYFALSVLSCKPRELRQVVRCIPYRLSETSASREQQLLHAAAEVADAELLLIFKHTFTYHMQLSSVRDITLDYAPSLFRTAESLASSFLAPAYVAVHWRVEWTLNNVRQSTSKAVLQRLQSCREGMVLAARGLLQDLAVNSFHNCSAGGVQESARGNGTAHVVPTHCGDERLHPVYLASDVTLSGIQSGSLVFKAKEKTIEIAVLQELRQVREQLRPAQLADAVALLNTSDRGVQAILEKMIAMRSSKFLGGPVVCGGTSSFMKEIVEYRMKHNLEVHYWMPVDE